MSRRRRLLAYIRTFATADGGGSSSHNSATRSSTDTMVPARASSRASAVFCLGVPRGSARPEPCNSTGPKIRTFTPPPPKGLLSPLEPRGYAPARAAFRRQGPGPAIDGLFADRDLTMRIHHSVEHLLRACLVAAVRRPGRVTDPRSGAAMCELQGPQGLFWPTESVLPRTNATCTRHPMTSRRPEHAAAAPKGEPRRPSRVRRDRDRAGSCPGGGAPPVGPERASRVRGHHCGPGAPRCRFRIPRPSAHSAEYAVR